MIFWIKKTVFVSIFQRLLFFFRLVKKMFQENLSFRLEERDFRANNGFRKKEKL